jgi:predicted molibdopterin-dependent oxidoreductase YjgC
MKDIIEHLSVEQIESLYEKTFGNPIDHYPSMEVSQMIDEIAEEHLSRNLFLKEASTQDLRNELELRGYQTNNLWHIEDVTQNYDCESEVAQEVLIKAMNNEATIGQVYLAIDIVADEVFNLKIKS